MVTRLEFLRTNPEYFSIERTSACHGEENPGGFGWLITYDDGVSRRQVTIPDNVADTWLGFWHRLKGDKL